MFSFFETATKRSFPQKGSFWKQGERCSHFADPRSFKGLWSAFGDWTCWKSIWLQFVPANWISRDTYWYQNPGIVWLSSIDPGFIRLCLSILYLWKDFAKDGRAPRVSEALPLVISSYDILICNLSNRKCVKFGVFRQISNDFLSKMMKFPFMKLAYPFENKRALLSLKPGRFPCITWVGCCQWFRPVGGVPRMSTAGWGWTGGLLGGGVKDVLEFSPRFLGEWSNLMSVFFKWVVQPPTSLCFDLFRWCWWTDDFFTCRTSAQVDLRLICCGMGKTCCWICLMLMNIVGIVMRCDEQKIEPITIASRMKSMTRNMSNSLGMEPPG